MTCFPDDAHSHGVHPRSHALPIGHRTAAVSAKDRTDFEVYLNDKRQRDLIPPAELNRPPKLDRRTILKVVTGTAVAGEAAALGYGWVKSGAADQGTASAFRNESQREPIIRELASTKSDVGGRSLGRWILLLPTKLGGGTYAIDLNSNRVLGSIWYWNYGDYNPISHHLCAFPSADPYHSFEFVNSTQGGKNSLIYGIPTRIRIRSLASTSIACAKTAHRWNFWRMSRKPPASGSACTSPSIPRMRSPIS
jgi:thiocyanate desulfurase